MIVFLVILFTLGAYGFGIYDKNRKVGNIVRIICDILLVVSLALVVMNDTQHFGMAQKTVTKTTAIESVSPNKQAPMLLYNKVGTKSNNNVYVYQNADDTKPSHTNPEYTTNSVKRTNGKTKLVSQKKYWTYKSKFNKFMFGVARNDNQWISTHNTFYIGNNWFVLSSGQAKKLQKLMKNPQMQAKMGQAMMQNPKATPAQKQQMLNKLLANVK